MCFRVFFFLWKYFRVWYIYNGFYDKDMEYFIVVEVEFKDWGDSCVGSNKKFIIFVGVGDCDIIF